MFKLECGGQHAADYQFSLHYFWKSGFLTLVYALISQAMGGADHAVSQSESDTVWKEEGI